jgi:hypothetical protein
MTRINLSPKLRLLGAVLAAVLVPAACTGDAAAPQGTSTVDRETFISTYVALRTAAIRNEGHEVEEGERASILARGGISEEDLMGFVDAHGTDVAFMRGVWDEVEARLDAVRVLPGTDDKR